jgi:hypothetical protein
MQRTVRVIEADVPGLSERPADWYERLHATAAAALRGEGRQIALLAIPSDETLMWLVWGRPDQSDPGPVVAEVVLREASSASGAAVIERAIEAHFVWQQSGGHDSRLMVGQRRMPASDLDSRPRAIGSRR